MQRDIKFQLPVIGLALLGLSFVSYPVAASDEEGAYGYFRTVEGSATVRGLDETYDAEVNRPLLTSDVLQTRFGSRVEVVLPDATRVRIGSDAEIVFDQMAFSADQWTDTTVLALRHGEMVVTIPEERPIEASTRIDAPNATFYLDEPGTYTVEARGYVTQIVIRQGFAEALTREGTHRLRAGEHAWIEGTEWPQVEIGRAGSRDDLERWAYDLDLEAARYASRGGDYVEGSLSYSTSRLDRYGSWHRDGGQTYWRPTRVSSSWRPYDDGYWVHTPSGLTWVSHEPWGWATYHYGSWDYHPRLGWAWSPGYRYAPAWVYWYWGPRYVGWCPVGYYTSYYGYGHRSYYRGFGIGIYGWAGGHHSNWKHWNFVDGDRLGDRRLARHTRPGAQLQAVQDHLDRGIITTDTSVLGRDAIRQPRAAIQVLENAKRTRTGGDLPDLTDFVARKDISGDMKRVAMPVRESGEGPTSPRAVSVTPRPRDSGAADERGSDTRRIRSATPTGVRGGPATTPSSRAQPRSGATPRTEATPRPRTTAPRNPDDGNAREPRAVMQARPSEGIRTGSGRDGEWRSRPAEPPRVRTQDRPTVNERPGTRSSSPARRVLEGVRSDRSSSPPAGARQSTTPPPRPRATPPPSRTESSSPDRATRPRSTSPRPSTRSSRPSTRPRSTTPRPSTRSSRPSTTQRSTTPRPSTRSSRPSTTQRSTSPRPSTRSSKPQATKPRSSTSSSRSSSSSVKQRSTSSSRRSSSSASQRSSSRSRSTATRGSSGSSSRGSSRSTAQRSRGSSNPDR